MKDLATTTIDLPGGTIEIRDSGGDGPLVVFVHGGYWLRFHRDIWSHFAQGLTARGWAVAMPSYTLAPEARIAAMTTPAELSASTGWLSSASRLNSASPCIPRALQDQSAGRDATVHSA